MHLRSRLYYLILLLNVFAQYARETDTIEHIRQGNLALSSSQQVTPLFAFGQNIAERHNFQLMVTPNQLKGHNQRANELEVELVYSIRDNLSLLANGSYIRMQQDGMQSSGVGDAFMQVEYAFYNKGALTYGNQATVVGNISFPTGSIERHPPLGNGATTFFLGLTANHTAIKWYYFASTGVTFPTTSHGNRPGNNFVYQGGIGRNIPTSSRSILAVLLELNGTYSGKNTNCGVVDNNSGGNVFYIGPSLWFSTARCVLQIGILGAVTQQLYGSQNKNNYFAALSFWWKIH